MAKSIEMTRKNLARPLLPLFATLLAGACQPQPTALFDDSLVPASSGAGGSFGSGPLDRATGGGAATDGHQGHGGDTATTGADGGAGTAAPGASGGGGNGAIEGTGGQHDDGSSGAASAEAAGAGGELNSSGQPLTVVRELQSTSIARCHPDQNLSGELTLKIDGTGCEWQALIQGLTANLPEGAVMRTATLRLKCVNRGKELQILYATTDWSASTVTHANRPAAGDLIGTARCTEIGARIYIDLAAPLAAWLAGERPSFGIYLVTKEQDQTEFLSSAAPEVGERPSLKVTYTL